MKKGKFNKWIILVALLLVLVIVWVLVIKSGFSKKQDNGDIIVKDNVHTITRETDSDKQPDRVKENELVFSKNPRYKKGDIVVAGIIDSAENGFIRRVLETTEKNGGYVVKTEPAVLTDVFEKAHIVKSFTITDSGIEEDDFYSLQSQMSDEVQGMAYSKNEKKNTYSVIKLSDTEEKKNDSTLADSDYLVGLSFDENIEDVTIKGDAGFNVWIEIILDIQNGEVKFGVAIKDESGTEIHLQRGSDLEKEVEKNIYKKILPNYEFNVAGVPVVVTNEIGGVIGGNIDIEGAIGISYESTSENIHGFMYDSRTNKVEEIKENKYQSDGLEWDTMQVSGSSTAEISLHLITKLYGSTGMDLSVGVSGDVNGEAKLSANPELVGYAGKLELSIAPKVDGTLVVSVPVIDEKLIEQPLFRVELKPFWEKTWESSQNWKEDLEWTGTGEQGVTYITRYGEINMVSCPVFQFNVPTEWEIETEQVNNGIVDENVVISNDNGIKVSYWSCQSKLGGGSQRIVKANITKVADSEFVAGYPSGTNTDYSHLGKFMVARVDVVGEAWMGENSDYTSVDGETFYAVVPESYLGEREFVSQAGNIDEFSFEYPTPYAFIAESSNGKFTEQDEREVIEILKSFKTK